MHVACRNCGAGLKTKDSNVGKRMRCPKCGTVTALASVVGSVRVEAPATTTKTAVSRSVQGMPPLTTLLGVAFVLLAMFAWFKIQMSAKDEQVNSQRQNQVLLSKRVNTQAKQIEELLTDIESLASGPEQRYQRAASLLRETRYREAEQVFEDVVAMYPSHELVPMARVELERLRELLMDRNLSELGLKVSEPASQWVTEGGQLGLLSPEITLRLRNMGVRSLEGLHLRVDFIATKGQEQQVLGDGLIAVPGILEPKMSTSITLRCLGTFETISADGEGRIDLPEVSAHVYVKEPGQAFRRVGVFAVAQELAAEAPR